MQTAIFFMLYFFMMPKAKTKLEVHKYFTSTVRRMVSGHPFTFLSSTGEPLTIHLLHGSGYKK